ncbi:MAG: DUF6165 family protein [Acidiferrobacterales bacterium]
MNMTVEVSIGEFLDKVSILRIKSERINDPEKLKNITKELTILEDAWANSAFAQADIASKLAKLKEINERLWEIEDRIRIKEAQKQFDDEFIELARSVYLNNDERSDVKRELSFALGSELIEEKSYADYRQQR